MIIKELEIDELVPKQGQRGYSDSPLEGVYSPREAYEYTPKILQIRFVKGKNLWNIDRFDPGTGIRDCIWEVISFLDKLI